MLAPFKIAKWPGRRWAVIDQRTGEYRNLFVTKQEANDLKNWLNMEFQNAPKP